jgi:hypothetical protein
VHALRYAGFPYAFQTLGSCITVKSKRYQKEGGMNTRKAGEDFYFLHKVIPNGLFGEIPSAIIYPSGRVSDRVPFGTGHAVGKRLKDLEVDYTCYDPQIFEALKEFLKHLVNGYQHFDFTPEPILEAFLAKHNFQYHLSEARKQAKDQRGYLKRIFAWMDGFRILKFVHHFRDEKYPNVALTDTFPWLSGVLPSLSGITDADHMLPALRSIDRSQSIQFTKNPLQE